METEDTPKRIEYPSLMQLNKRELANHLSALLRKGTPRLLVNRMRDVVLKQREELRRHKIHLTVTGKLWSELIRPLQAERKNVRASLSYKTEDDTDPRAAALLAYKEVLDTLLNRMDSLRQGGKHTPSTYATEKNLTNHGLHWTDFVPVHIKLRVSGLFDAVPHKPKAKRKVPFERLVQEDIHEQRKHRLRERTTKALLRANQDSLLNPSDAADALVQRIKVALSAIEKLDPNEPVPTTWHGLY